MTTPSSRSHRRWPIYAAIAAGLPVAAYLIATSSAFLRGVVVPRVGSAMQCDLSVGAITLSPFSSLTLRDVRLAPTGGETLLTVGEVRLRYRLSDILRGRIAVSEATVEGPTVTVVTAPDGTSNLSRWTASLGGSPSAPRSGASAPTVLDVRNVNLRNGVIRMTEPAGPGSRTLELAGLNLALDSLTSSAPGRLNLGATFRMTADGTHSVAGQASGEFQLRLNEQLQLRELNGVFQMNATEASGQWRDCGRLALKLTADSTGSEIRQVRLEVTDQGRPAGEIQLSGPFDPDKKEAQIAYEVKGIGRSALGLVGAFVGVDFGATRVEASGRVNLERAGTLVSWQGRFTADPLSLATASGSTPVLGLTSEFRIRADMEERTALIEKADVSLRQGTVPVVQGSLDRPMNIGWDTAAKGFRDATYVLAVKQLDLAAWRTLTGPGFPAGMASLEARVTSDRDGRLLRCLVTGGVTDLTVPGGAGPSDGLRLEFEAAGSLEDFKKALLERVSGQLQQGAQRLAQLSGLAQVNLRNREFSGQFSADATLPGLLKMHPVDGLRLSAGTATAAVQVDTQNGQTNISAGFACSGLTGDLFGVAIRDYAAKVDLGARLGPDKVLLQRGMVSLQAGSDAPGSIELSGEFEPVAKRGDFRFKGVNLNEKSLAPLVARTLHPRRLESVAIEFSGDTHLDLSAKSTVSSTLQVNRLVVREPSSSGAAAPISLGATLEGSGTGRSLDLTRLAVRMQPTPRAAQNELLGTGHLELATNNAASGTLSFTSPGLDLTPLADLVAGAPESPVTPPASPPVAASPLGDPVVLPFGRLVMEAKLDAVFLREVAVSNWVARVELKRDGVTVNPFSLTLNGAPVSASADINVGVPGYVYDMKGRLTSVPVSPLARSFLSGDLVDLGGTLDSTLDLKGAGVEGAALRKHLVGSAAFSATNLNYRITSLKTPLMQALVRTLSTTLRLPSISESPIQRMEARLSAAQGVATLESARVSSAAFMASARGEVRIADILTNSSIALPVTVSLPKNGGWDELPTFLTLKGTLGAPRPDIDALALAQTMTRLPGAAGDLSNRGVEKLGSALDRALGGKSGTNTGAGTSLIKGLLGGRPPETNAVAGTNAAAATNAPPAPFNPLDLLKKKPAKP